MSEYLYEDNKGKKPRFRINEKGITITFVSKKIEEIDPIYQIDFDYECNIMTIHNNCSSYDYPLSDIEKFEFYNMAQRYSKTEDLYYSNGELFSEEIHI